MNTLLRNNLSHKLLVHVDRAPDRFPGDKLERGQRWHANAALAYPKQHFSYTGINAETVSEPVKNLSISPESGEHPTSHPGYTASGSICPRCNGGAYRIPRRLVDLVLSSFVQVIRCRCRSPNCNWEGNLRTKRYPSLSQGPW